jgi:hypothetical protein
VDDGGDRPPGQLDRRGDVGHEVLDHLHQVRDRVAADQFRQHPLAAHPVIEFVRRRVHLHVGPLADDPRRVDLHPVQGRHHVGHELLRVHHHLVPGLVLDPVP